MNLFTLLAKRGHLPVHLQTQKLALVVITQEAEAHSFTVRSHLMRSVAAPPAPLGASRGRTAVLPFESGFIGRRRGLGRALYPPTDASFEMAL